MNIPSSPSKTSTWTVYLILMLPPLMWAGNFVVGRAIRDDVSPTMLSFGRWIIALAFLLPFSWKAIKHDLPRYWQYRWPLLGVSVTGITLFNSLVYAGLHSTTASNALLMNSFIPVIILIISALFYGQKLNSFQIIGLALSCFGVFTIILAGDWHNLVDLQFSSGDLIVFLAIICFALYTLWLKKLPKDLNRIGLLSMQMLIGVAILLPFYLWEAMHGMHNTWNVGTISGLIYVGIFASVIAYFLFMIGVSKVGPERAGVFMHLMPVFGAILSVIFLGESLHAYHAVGIIAIFIGLALSNMQKPQIKSIKHHIPDALLKTK